MTGWNARRDLAFGLLMVLLILSSCVERDEPPAEVVVDWSSTPIRVTIPPPGELSAVVTGELVPELEVGSLDGPHDAFGRIVALERSPQDHLYVADASVSAVLVFDEEGAYLRTIGGPGEGPGEFGMISGIRIEPSGLLWVMDPLYRRLTAFGSEGDLVTTVFRDDLSRSASIPWGGDFDTDGRLLDLRSISLPESQTLREVVAYGLGPDRYEPIQAVQLPTVSKPMYESVSQGGAIRMRSPVPHAPIQRWAPGGAGEIWLTESVALTLHRVSFAGDTILSVSVDVDPVLLSGATRDSLAAVTGLSLGEIPEHRRVVRNLVPAVGGAIWVLAEVGGRNGGLEWYHIESDGLVRYRVPHRLPRVDDGVHPIIKGDKFIMNAHCDSGAPCVIVASIETPDRSTR